VDSVQSTTSHDDTELVSRIVDDDRDALETVYRRYGGAVKSMALRVLRDEALAEDTVQEVFVKFWEAPERFDADRGSLRTFLLTIAHRRAVDTVRSEQARATRQEKVPEDVAGSLEDEVWSRVVSDQVRVAVESLSVGEREAIELAYFGHLSYIEVARRLGLPEGTVKSRIRSGMRRLGLALAEAAS
jgi:RNA polymerase sigma-70 factor (ECF subfamily)